jgi:hypothetical protein
MGSVASTNAGLSDLLQTLSNENSPLLSTLSSPKVEAALEKAPASDIAQISDQALQLQVANALFAPQGTTNSNADPLLAVLTSAYTGTTVNPNPSAASLFDVFA